MLRYARNDEDHLEGRGLVRRTASTINRRYYVLYLTEAGTALLGRLRPAAAESDKALAAKIGPRAYQDLRQTGQKARRWALATSPTHVTPRRN